MFHTCVPIVISGISERTQKTKYNMNNIKTFEEYISLKDQEEIDESKLTNILKATALAAGLMLGNHYFDKIIKGDDIKTDKVENVKVKTANIVKKAKEKVAEVKEKAKPEQISLSDYKPSDEILDYIKKAEGWHQGWKNDGKGNPTTGWGFKVTKELKKKYPNGMTKEQADKYFLEVAIPKRIDEFRKAMPDQQKYTQKQLDALFDLYYNVGYGTFTKGSPKLQTALEKGDYDAIVAEMNHDYDNKKLPGLRIRRDFEKELFMYDVEKA